MDGSQTLQVPDQVAAETDVQMFARALIRTPPAERAERMRKWLVFAAHNYRVAAGAERAAEELSALLEKAQDQADEEAA